MQNSPKLDKPLRELKQLRRATGYLPIYERDGVPYAEGSAHARLEDAYDEIINDPLPGCDFLMLLVTFNDGTGEVDATPLEAIRGVVLANERDERRHTMSLAVGRSQV